MRVRKKTVAGIGLTPLFMLWVSVCSADIPRWLSVMPLHEQVADELAADAAALGNDTFVDGIAWSCPVNPEGNCPNLGAEPVYEAPGSILFENAAGGRVLVLAQKILEMMPRYYEATLFSESYKAAIFRCRVRK